MADETHERVDIGLSHIALVVRDVTASIRFYERFAGLGVVHRRKRNAREVVWLSDRTRPFVLVLVEADHVDARLEGTAHLGVGCASRKEVDSLAEQADAEGWLLFEPCDAGPPVGYTALLRDPDGHNLELSHGQQVGLAVSAAPAGEPREGG